jgi:ankyrin repeat protein
MGADAIVKSAIFGAPLYMLARNGSLSTVRVILDNDAVPRNQHATRLVRHKMRRVLSQAAAVYGREDIVRLLLEERYCTGQPGRGLGGAITKAVEHGYHDIAGLLLQHRIPYPSDKKSRRKNSEYAFWYYLVSACVNYNAESILRVALDRQSEEQGNWLKLPLEVARKNKLERLVVMMEEYLGRKAVRVK